MVLRVVVEVVIKARVIDSVYVDVAVGSRKRFSKEGIVPLSIGSVGGVEIL